MSISPRALERMKELIGGDETVLAEILQSFIDEAEPLAEAVLAAARDGRLDLLGRAAHTIKSSARDFGDAEFAELCAAIEFGSKHGALVDAMESSQLIARGCLTLKEELAAYIGRELNGETT
ncbi:Hpt domain-containing protein [Nordella sp. HKS 07]|uniref:Hpt domain-containing protein n=1 Tax=Nordella sp. HKS 07 TaxID=2712222 RepID=UPI0013E1E70C|nr:Hpt domain-containing protein [Nordella sp. HKS 07]QIG51980.1 Hpt domain-containing protein [Nordella sp. HKS 07]